MYLNTLIFPRVDKRDDPDKKISRYSALEGRQQRLQIRRGMEFTTPTPAGLHFLSPVVHIGRVVQLGHSVLSSEENPEHQPGMIFWNIT